MASQTVRNDTNTFLKTVTAVLGWKYLISDVVIDIGCGIGRTAMTILDIFPEIRKVVAIDISMQRLRIAEEVHSDQKIVYELADISNKESIARWAGQMDKAVSVFCFNCLDDVRSGYENMFRLLKPAGEAAILQSLRSGYYDFINEINDSPKWKNYFKGKKVALPVSHIEEHSGDYYKKMLEEIGFEVVDCYEEVNAYGRIFTSDDDCKNVLYKTCRLACLLPEDKRAEFREDCYEVFLKHNKRNDQGYIVMEHSTFSAFLRKPRTAPPDPSSE